MGGASSEDNISVKDIDFHYVFFRLQQFKPAADRSTVTVVVQIFLTIRLQGEMNSYLAVSEGPLQRNDGCIPRGD